MSLVVAYQHEGKVYMASDSQATSNDEHVRFICHPKMYKSSKFLIGYSGSIRQAQVAMKANFDGCDDVVDLVELNHCNLLEI
jgi:ATP-dependent protease HslVU (ClpYQ) peptidase subunit